MSATRKRNKSTSSRALAAPREPDLIEAEPQARRHGTRLNDDQVASIERDLTALILKFESIWKLTIRLVDDRDLAPSAEDAIHSLCILGAQEADALIRGLGRSGVGAFSDHLGDIAALKRWRHVAV
jgi:hypothetical protein